MCRRFLTVVEIKIVNITHVMLKKPLLLNGISGKLIRQQAEACNPWLLTSRDVLTLVSKLETKSNVMRL